LAVGEEGVGLLLPEAEEADDLVAVHVAEEAAREAQPGFELGVVFAFAGPRRREGREEEGQ